MKHLPYQAVIVDFDRTLLHTDKTISEYTVKVFREWQEAGARLFAATARPERAVGIYRETIPFDAVTTLNGARTLTPGALFEEPISAQSAENILEQLYTDRDMVISVETGSGIFASTDIPLWSPVVVKDIRKLAWKEKIYKILASHPLLPADRIAGRRMIRPLAGYFSDRAPVFGHRYRRNNGTGNAGIRHGVNQIPKKYVSVGMGFIRIHSDKQDFHICIIT